MSYVRYVLWKCITTDGVFWLLIFFVAAGIGLVVWSLFRRWNASGLGTFAGIIVGVVSILPLWWYPENLVDRKGGLPEPAGFAFVKDIVHGVSNCAVVRESVLVIQLTLCGITDSSVQNRVLAEIQKRRPLHGGKPVVVTFIGALERHEHDGAVWYGGGSPLREELLASRSNLRLQSEAPKTART